MKLLALMLLLPAAALLSGCETTSEALHSIPGGECKAFERPPYAVKGKTRYDQGVVDNFVETGVGACHWDRPARRPPELDRPAATAASAVPLPKPRPGIIHRAKQKAQSLHLWPAGQTDPVMPTPVPPAAASRSEAIRDRKA